MGQILRAFMVDSISQGKSMEFKILGGTSLSGLNGSGKTTILKLNPFFYGERPSLISARVGDVSKPFAEFYLPRQTSYVVFEYVVRGKNRCLVSYSNNTDPKKSSSVVYHLVDAAYDSSWFFEEVEGEKVLVLNSDFRRKLEAKDIFCTQKIGVKQYRSILQSNMNSRDGTLKDQRILNGLRSRFSICPPGGDLSNIHDICSGVLNRAPSLDSIKESLQATLVTKHNLNPDLSLNINEDHIGNWLNGYTITSNIKNQEKNIEGLNNHRLEIDAVIHSLSNYKSLCQQRLEHVKSINTEAEDLSDQSSKEIEIQSRKLEAILLSYSAIKNSKINELEINESELRSLERDKNSYDLKDIPEQKSLASDLENTTSAYEIAVERHKELMDGVESLYEYFKAEISNLDAEILIAKNNSEKTMLLVSSEINEKIVELRDSGAEKTILATTNQKLKRNIVVAKVTETSEKTAQIKGRLHQVVNSPEMIKEIKDQENEIELSRENVSEEQKELQESISILSALRSELDKSLSDLSALNIKISEHDAEYEKIQLLNSPEKGTLLAYLKDNNVPDWADTIAKTINPELLANKSLSPSLIDNTNSSFYNLNLDLSGIEKPDYSSPEELVEKLNKLVLKKELLDSNKNDLNTSIKKLSVNKKAAESKVSLKDHAVKVAQQLLSEDLLELKELKSRATIEIELIKNQMNKDLSIAQEDKKLANDNYANFEKNCEIELSKINNETKEKIDLAKRDGASKLSKIKAKQESEAIEFNNRSIDLKEQEDKALIENNLDPEQIKIAKEKVNKLKNKKALCSNAILTIEQYELFIAKQWIKSGPLKALIKDINIQIAKLKAENEKDTRYIKTEIGNLKGILNQSDLNIAKYLNQITKLESIKLRLENYEIPEKTPELKVIHDNDYLQQEMQNCFAKIANANIAGFERYKEIAAVFCRYSGTGANEYFKTAEIETQNLCNKTDIDMQKWYFMSERIYHFIKVEIHNQISLLNTETKNHCIHISDFATSLSQSHIKIGEMGRKLTHHAADILERFRFPAIDSLEIKVSSKMDDLDYWNDLQNFQKVYNQWLTLGDNDVPPKSLLSQLDKLKSIVKGTGLSVSIKDSFSLEISVVEQGKHKTARTNKEVIGLSSKGLSYLIVIIIYTSLINLLRGKNDVNICWAIDELKDLDRPNSKEIARLLKSNNITLIAAYPDADPDLLEDYKNAYEMKPGRILCTYDPDTIQKDKNLVNSLISNIQKKVS